jgi:hypothetical protein
MLSFLQIERQSSKQDTDNMTATIRLRSLIGNQVKGSEGVDE